MTKHSVCYNCFNEQSLKDFIKETAIYKECDYCKEKSIDNIAISFDNLISKIIQSLELKYIDPHGFLFSDDTNSWDQCSDSYDMFHMDEAKLECINDELRNDIYERLLDRMWFNEEILYPSYSSNLFMSWEYFAKVVKEQWRYTFFFTSGDPIEPSVFDPKKTFDIISNLIKNHNLISELPKDTTIYRSRFHDANEIVKMATHMGTPLSKFVTSPNRLSPIGIPMFYGSFDKNTTILEVKPKDIKNKICSTGIFKNNVPIKVVDFTKKQAIPGFYSKKNKEREPIMFLNKFVNLISKPIIENDEYLEYIPTQVFTEYIRSVALKKLGIKGILYNSAKSDKKNIALFYLNTKCKDQGTEKEDEDCLILQDIISKK